MTPLLTMANGTARPLEAVPVLDLEDLRAAIASAPSQGRRVSAYFATPRGEGLALFVVLADDDTGLLEIASTSLSSDTARAFPSITPENHEVHLFEREIAEQWGVVPSGHPWLKPVRFHSSHREGVDAWGRTQASRPVVGVQDFFRVEGEEVHEVAVGPVHAGIIEPGHFRFQCHGEHVFHLEIALGYQHRGIERSLVAGPHKRSIHVMETLAGDTTVGHATAYCQNLEALSGRHATSRGCAIRGIALELERLANHTGDLGALAGDVGFLPTASFCGRLRGDFLNMTALICGSRFGRGLVRPGGVAFDLEEARASELRRRLDATARDVENAAQLLWSTPTVMARFEETGRVPTEVASELGLVGVAARASGLRRDVRETHPSGIFRVVHVPMSIAESGDVFARAYVRWLEIERSIDYIRAQLGELPRGRLRNEGFTMSTKGPMRRSEDGATPGSTANPVSDSTNGAASDSMNGSASDSVAGSTTSSARGAAHGRANSLAVSLVEGWRGEICHVAITGEDGRFTAYKIVDPSFHNWTGLAMALRDQQISDFPLCNKSFNLSYCGHDL